MKFVDLLTKPSKSSIFIWDEGGEVDRMVREAVERMTKKQFKVLDKYCREKMGW